VVRKSKRKRRDGLLIRDKYKMIVFKGDFVKIHSGEFKGYIGKVVEFPTSRSVVVLVKDENGNSKKVKISGKNIEFMFSGNIRKVR